MPGRLKVKVIAGRHLPIMDRASDLTDAFVEVSFEWVYIYLAIVFAVQVY